MFCRTLLSVLYACLAAPALFTAVPAWGQSQDYDVRPQSNAVTGETLRQVFTGSTHAGAYNFDWDGTPGNRYTEWHSEDGRVIYREDDQVITGTWDVLNDQICYDYDSETLTGGCFAVFKLGTCYYFYSARYAQLSGEDDFWTARSVPKGERATCEDMIG